MKKKRILSLSMALVITAMGLSGCEKNNTIEEATKAIEVDSTINFLDWHEKKPEARTFGPGEHVFFKRYYAPYNISNRIDKTSITNINQGSISAPGGYEVLSVNTISEGYTKYNPSTCIDVWFKNIDTVIVEPVYNEITGLYDYSDFGMIDLIDYGEIYPTRKK